jgi:hypothetical protein
MKLNCAYWGGGGELSFMKVNTFLSIRKEEEKKGRNTRVYEALK